MSNTETDHDKNDSIVDAAAALALITIVITAAVFWISLQ